MIELPGIKNIIAIASGKGGVGKSTLAVNLALALSLENQKTGLIDADIYGPSVPLMLGINYDSNNNTNNNINPITKYNLAVLSIGFFLNPETPAIWRGPMASKYLQELFHSFQVYTTEKSQEKSLYLDYLIIDLPPGTGDIQLTLSQKIKMTGVIIITTPQDIALIDAKKAVNMFEKVNVPLLGIVENMSVHECEKCGYEEEIFGAGGAEKMSTQFKIELLGKIPLTRSIRTDADQGKPTVIAEPESKTAMIYRDIAKRVIKKINLKSLLTAQLPPIQKN